MDLTGKRILVVGASGVLGGELTRQLTATGAQVLGSARSQESASNLPREVALRLVCDLNDPASIAVLANYIVANEEIDGVVLATGLVGFGTAVDTLPEAATQLMQVNALGPAQLLAGLAPALRGRPEAFVAAITGVVAEKSFPGMSAYCASKSALSAWLASAAVEWRREGIRVLEARPGHTETGLAARPLFGRAPTMPAGMTAQHVAQTIVAGLVSGATVLASSDF